MKQYNFTGQLKILIEEALEGKSGNIDFIMSKLNHESSLAMTRFVDYALSQVNKDEGIERIRHYLFNGTLIQRNYSSLYFNRSGKRECVKEAYEKGLIDEIQAFAR